MTSPPQTPARGVPVARPADASRAAPKPTVGPYSLLAPLGEGGMGVVHLARRGPDGPRVALKVLRPHIVGDQEARHRLAREVSALARIRSRWVAEIVDADPWAPTPYVAMRYVPGLSLHDHVVDEGPVTGRDLIHLATCLAQGLAAVHAVDVLHRDVKPSNVLMEGRTPILIDFGLARVADDPRLTHTGWLLGTPGFLAPEILYGDDATTASDVHSWAATVAYAALGSAPFGRGPAMAIMDRVRRGEHDLTGIDDPLHQLLAECLDPEPAHRPTLPDVLGWLRPHADDRRPLPSPTVIRPPAPAFTQPYAAVAAPPAPPARPGLPAPGQPTVADGWNRTLVEAAPATGVLEPSAEEHRVSAVERVRRAAVLVGAAAVVGALAAAYPWLALLALVVLVWLLRSGSLAASAAGDRRRVRGRRWYDGVRFLVAAPWHLVRSVPSTIVLLLWSGGLAVATALVCYAVVAGQGVTLFVCGASFALAVWTGPGGSLVRTPLARVVQPLSRRWKPWLAAVTVLVVAALALGDVAESLGADWVPGQHRPFHQAGSRTGSTTG